jgi:hypothetical protein
VPRVWRFGWMVVLAVLGTASVVQAQVFVSPRRAEKSQVRHFRFEWRHIDIAVGSEADTRQVERVERSAADAGIALSGEAAETSDAGLPEVAVAGTPDGGTADGGFVAETPAADAGTWASKPTVIPDAGFETELRPNTGGVRLYFYESERQVAERALPLILDAYRDLVQDFRYVPSETFPYILYSSYQEFLQTNLFPLQEGVLGVTSPQDLKLTLPYFGDQRMFAMVSKHEMAHQFTIQKLRSLAKATKVFGNPIDEMPLWFVEGLAEFYAQGGLDPEAEMLVRDLLVNPDVANGYAMIGFFEDRPGSVLWTYKVGQVRCAFLEELYGKGFIQRLLEASPQMVGSFRESASVKGFPALIQRLTGDDERVVARKFESWIKRHTFRDYLEADQDAPAIKPAIEDVEGIALTLASSPEGNLILYRSINPDSGQSSLYMFDRRDPTRQLQVAADGVPGIESLHPITTRNFDIRADALVFSAESGSRDVLYWRKVASAVERRVETTTNNPLVPTPSKPPPTPWSVRLALGEQRDFHIGEHGLLGVFSPSFSPDGKRIAFIGLTEDGQRDIFVLDPTQGDDFKLTRITRDMYAERQLSWGKDGIVFNSNATSHGKYNLFQVVPEAPSDVKRLTTEARDENDPRVLPNGRVVFTAYDSARSDIYEVVGPSIVRHTEISTGFTDVGAGPENSLIALFHYAGQKRPVLIPAHALRPRETIAQPPGEPPVDRPVRSLAEGSQPYRWLSFENLELGPLFGIVGGSSYGIAGQIFASVNDKLRNHAVFLQAAVYGSFDLTDGLLVYVNQENRVTWGGGLFQSLRYRVDRTFGELTPLFTSGERFWGLLGSARYPFNTFMYLQADVAVGGVSYFLFPYTGAYLEDGIANGTDVNLLSLWERENSGIRFQTEGSLRLGYDTIRYYRGTGAVAGHSVLLEGTVATQPKEGEVFGNLRLDAEQLFPISGRTHIFLRGGVGTTLGGRLAREYYLSSFDTMRGVPFGDVNWLLGRDFFFSTLELQFPLTAILQLVFLSDIEGIVALDFGGVGNRFEEAWGKRVLDVALGVNLGLGPFLLRLHFARPIDTGAPAGMPVRNGEWTTNFSLGLVGWDVGLTAKGGYQSQRHMPQVGMQNPMGSSMGLMH